MKFQVHGLKEMQTALEQLRKEVAGKDKAGSEGNLVRLALGHVARDVKKKAIFLAPMSQQGSNIDWHRSKKGKLVHGGPMGKLAPPGRLRRAILVKYERNPRNYSEIVYVGVRNGSDRNDPNGAWYAPIVEFQGGAGGIGKGFLRNSISPAFHTKMFADKVGAGIARVAKKIGSDNLREVAAKARAGIKVEALP